MPELPEVETIRRDLEGQLKEDGLASLQVLDRRLLSVKEEGRWLRQTLHHSWTQFSRHGKYLEITLSNAWRIVFHLRMTGQLVLEAENNKMSRLRLLFASGRRLDLIDQRRFAEAWLLAPEQAWPGAAPLGPDALTGLNEERFLRIVQERTTRIQPLLMDQRLLAGVGNIYAQEALFKALIRPSRPGRRVSRDEAIRLYRALQETLQAAIEHRGSTSRNYRDAYGRAGSAQTLHAVYRRGGQPCLRCRHLLKASRVGGRGTVYCPRCQR